jgi:hypothetical protein
MRARDIKSENSITLSASLCVSVISCCVICVVCVCVDSDKSSCLFSICYSNQSISLFIKHTVTKPAGKRKMLRVEKWERARASEREKDWKWAREREIKLYIRFVWCCLDYTEPEEDIIIIRRVAILISRFYSPSTYACGGRCFPFAKLHTRSIIDSSSPNKSIL